MLCRTVFSTEEVTTTKTNPVTSNAVHCDSVTPQVVKNEGKCILWLIEIMSSILSSSTSVIAGSQHLLDHMLGAEATIVTSSNVDDGVSCVPEPDENVSIAENENTQLQAQTPPRPGALTQITIRFI